MEKGGNDLVTVCKRRWNWALLHPELLVSIAQRLVIRDHVRFGAVCRSWASAAKESSPRPWPWLSFISETADDQRVLQLSLLDWSANKLYKPIPISSSDMILGHKEAWIILLDQREDQPILFHPLTGARHRLPSFSTIRDDITFNVYTKVVLTAVPNSSGNFPVVAIFILGDVDLPGFEHIVYTSLGGDDEKWTHIYSLHDDSELHDDDDADEILDGVYHEGMFYAVLKSGQLLHFDISITADYFDQEPPRLANKLPISEGTEMLLVSAPRRGDLLLVRIRRRRRFLTSDNIIEDIKIMKFDRKANRWVVADDLDGGCLFLDTEEATLLPNGPGLERGNCVLYIDEFRRHSQDELVHLVRVHDLEKKATLEACWTIRNADTSPTWFLPSLS